jgi:hypothetical protein
VIARDDVVNVDRGEFRGDATEFAAPARGLEYPVPRRCGNTTRWVALGFFLNPFCDPFLADCLGLGYGVLIGQVEGERERLPFSVVAHDAVFRERGFGPTHKHFFIVFLHGPVVSAKGPGKVVFARRPSALKEMENDRGLVDVGHRHRVGQEFDKLFGRAHTGTR